MKLKKDNPPHAAGESNALEGRSIAGGGTAFQARKSHERAKPPARGLRLGLRLGLTTSLIVSLVLGTLMILHQGRETGREWKAREDLLKESLSPLASDIENASSTEEIQQRLSLFHQSYVNRGYPDHQVMLFGGDGSMVASSCGEHELHAPPQEISASIPIISALLPGGTGTLTVWQDGSEFYADVSQRWRLMWAALSLTILAILFSLQAANYFLVTRPFRKLLEGVRKMEMGYWGTLEVPRGAWEMRWLAWRFRNLGTELEETVRRLVEAERRGLVPARRPGDSDRQNGDNGEKTELLAQRKNVSLRHEFERHLLWDKCRLLESLPLGDSASQRIAREAWDRDALAADRLGEDTLKAKLEDAAFRILEPDIFEDVRRRVSDELMDSQRKWLKEREAEIRRGLEEKGIPNASVQYRVKHPAGIWRKMQAKGLTFEEIYDLFAFRIIVGGEEECYLALDALHRLFRPRRLRFKDYIAWPKSNGYKSLHTCVHDEAGRMFEIQIRSADMHRQAEPTHWSYKSSALVGEVEDSRPSSFLRKLGIILSAGWARHH